MASSNEQAEADSAWYKVAAQAVISGMQSGTREPAEVDKTIQVYLDGKKINILEIYPNTNNDEAKAIESYKTDLSKAYINYAARYLSEMQELKTDPNVADPKIVKSLKAAGSDMLALYPEAGSKDAAGEMYQRDLTVAQGAYPIKMAALKQELDEGTKRMAEAAKLPVNQPKQTTPPSTGTPSNTNSVIPNPYTGIPNLGYGGVPPSVVLPHIGRHVPFGYNGGDPFTHNFRGHGLGVDIPLPNGGRLCLRIP